MNKSKSGFTIVELLIVIVVIAILAAISIVAYTGIQQRAANSSTISSVSQVLKAIAGYGALHGTYPVPGNNQFCAVPAENGSCTAHSTTQRSRASNFDNNIAGIATLPVSVPDGRSDFMGITINYNLARVIDGESRPMTIQYSLRGNQQPCGLPNVVAWSGTTLSTTEYSSSADGYTICILIVPNP